MITTCDRCLYGKDQGVVDDPNDKYYGQRFFYCKATNFLIRARSALDENVRCEYFKVRE